MEKPMKLAHWKIQLPARKPNQWSLKCAVQEKTTMPTGERMIAGRNVQRRISGSRMPSFLRVRHAENRSERGPIGMAIRTPINPPKVLSPVCSCDQFQGG